MYFLIGFVGGLYLYCIDAFIKDKIQFWLWNRRERAFIKSGGFGVHFHWSDLEAAHEAGRQAVQAKMGLDEIVQHCNQVINEAREAKHGRT